MDTILESKHGNEWEIGLREWRVGREPGDEGNEKRIIYASTKKKSMETVTVLIEKIFFLDFLQLLYLGQTNSFVEK